MSLPSKPCNTYATSFGSAESPQRAHQDILELLTSAMEENAKSLVIYPMRPVKGQQNTIFKRHPTIQKNFIVDMVLYSNNMIIIIIITIMIMIMIIIIIVMIITYTIL